MSIDHIRKTYGVPFKVGQQVRIRRGKELFMGGETGKLLRARGAYLVVKGATWEGSFHPADVEQPTPTERDSAGRADMSATKCTVEDGKHVRPCKWLEKSTEGRGNAGRERGIRVFDYSIDAKPSRTFYAIKSAAFPKALAIDFCPFCGTQISAPFEEKTP